MNSPSACLLFLVLPSWQTVRITNGDVGSCSTRQAAGRQLPLWRCTVGSTYSLLQHDAQQPVSSLVTRGHCTPSAAQELRAAVTTALPLSRHLPSAPQTSAITSRR
jgi:hypothetical protein